MTQKPLSNLEIVVLALYALSGDGSPVSTEDVAVKANEIAPGRFAWKKYPEQINLEHVRVFLTDAKKEKNGRLVGGGNATGWILSDRGLALAKRRAPILGSVDLSRTPVSSKERLWRAREQARIEEAKQSVMQALALDQTLFNSHYLLVSITHRLESIRNFEHIIVLDRGQIREQGSHRTLLKQRGLYFELWTKQQDS